VGGPGGTADERRRYSPSGGAEPRRPHGCSNRRCNCSPRGGCTSTSCRPGGCRSLR
jgi:hypothetical protein